MKLAVLMTCHNRKVMTLRCLRGLLPQLGVEDRVFVVDDGSTDGTEEGIRDQGSGIRVIRGDGKLFWAKGMRLAWETAVKDGDWDAYLWLNDDTELLPNALERLRAVAGNGKIVVGDLANAKGEVVYGLRKDGIFTGNCVWVSREAYAKLGMICGDFHHAWADTDYAVRARRAGIEVARAGVVGHAEGHPNRPSLKGLGLGARWRMLFDPKGWCVHDLWLYRRRNLGVIAALASCAHLIGHVIWGERRLNAVWAAFLLFGAVLGVDVISNFDLVPKGDGSPFQTLLISIAIAVRNFIGHMLLPMGAVFLFGRLSRWFLVPAFAFLLLEEACDLYVERMFDASLAAEWLPLALNTTPGEVMQFLGMCATLGSVCVAVLMAGAVALGCYLLWRASYPRVSILESGSVVCAGILFLVLNALAFGSFHAGIVQTRYARFIFYGALSQFRGQGFRAASLRPNLPEVVGTTVDRDRLPDIVFVIGESATRNNWHLYGYPRRTTPCLDALRDAGELVVYTDVVGTQPTTDGAISLLLSDVSFDDPFTGNWTLPEAFRRAGYDCVLISNNMYLKCNATSTVYRSFNGCGKRIYVRENVGRFVYDGEMVPLVEQELENRATSPKLVFVHMAGTHFPVRNAAPPDEPRFDDQTDSDCLEGLPEESRDRFNRYDTGIRYCDKVLGAIADVLRRSKRPACLFYITDHGESPRSANWRTYSDEDVYELPVVFWFSKEYTLRFSEIVDRVRAASAKRLQPDEMTVGLLELGCLVDVADKARNFLEPNFRGRYPRKICDGRRTYSRDRRGDR